MSRAEPKSAVTSPAQLEVSAALGVPVQLVIPPASKGLVVVADDSRHHGNLEQVLAWYLRQAPIATMSIDSAAPGLNGLTRAWVGGIDWAHSQPDTARLPIALLASGPAMFAALAAAAFRPALVSGLVVVAGDRLAGNSHWLKRIAAPTLLIASRHERESLRASVDALDELPAPSELDILDGGPALVGKVHEFVEAANLARAWLARLLGGRA